MKWLAGPRRRLIAGALAVVLAGSVTSPAEAAPVDRDTAHWHLDRIDQRGLPMDTVYTNTHSGQGVDVYVVDTGVRASHKEFANSPGIGTVGWSYLNSDPSTYSSDCRGHGTQISSLIGGATLGVAPSARLIPVMVFCGPAASKENQVKNFVDGLAWVAQHHQAGQPAVVNISLGYDKSFFDPTMGAALEGAVQQLVDEGMTVVTSAGNTPVDSCSSFYVNNMPGVITVGAANLLDEFAPWSASGSCIALSAPGEFLRTAEFGADDAYGINSGTSGASAVVAGAAAVYLEGHPGASGAQVKAALIQNSSKDVLDVIRGGTPNRLLYSCGRDLTLDAPETLVGVVGESMFGTVTVGKNRCGPESLELSADGGILLNKRDVKLGSRTDDKSVDFFFQCAKPGTTTGTVTVTASPGNVPGPEEKVTRTIRFECQELQMEFAPPMVEVTAIEKKVSPKRKILLKKKAGPAVDVTVTSASCVVPEPGPGPGGTYSLAAGASSVEVSYHILCEHGGSVHEHEMIAEHIPSGSTAKAIFRVTCLKPGDLGGGEPLSGDHVSDVDVDTDNPVGTWGPLSNGRQSVTLPPPSDAVPTFDLWATQVSNSNYTNPSPNPYTWRYVSNIPAGSTVFFEKTKRVVEGPAPCGGNEYCFHVKVTAGLVIVAPDGSDFYRGGEGSIEFFEAWVTGSGGNLYSYDETTTYKLTPHKD